jgi:methylenetetrahydrofolate--tRNA-(uracil-5-)-methyltransferase
VTGPAAGAVGTRGPLKATVVGGGLAGSEAAWALANRGYRVTLHEMRPVQGTAAHQTDCLAELVCSNSFKSTELGNAHGLLKAELRELGSTTSLSFYDAIAPIVADESLDHEVLYALSRYGKGDGDDYLNAPLGREGYELLIDALLTGDQYRAHDFDQVPYFEGCLPIEEMAVRGRETLRFGPMKPVGLPDPRTGREPWAVVQLRREDRAGQMWNLVGFQTRLRIPEQQRVFRLIPGLATAEFLRYGSIHRNSYINSPASLGPGLATRDGQGLFFAGQITGVEGYTESLGTGILAGVNLARFLEGKPPAVPPPTTMLGALLRYLRDADPTHFQPMNANFGLLEPLPGKVRKDQKKAALAERALADFQAWVKTL